jgi:hypothetical protein
LLGPVFSVIENFGHPRMIPILPSVFSVFLYSVFGLFGPVFGHDHIDQIEEHMYINNGSRTSISLDNTSASAQYLRVAAQNGNTSQITAYR